MSTTMPHFTDGKFITSVWSSYGHTFMSTGEDEEYDGLTVGHYVTCLTCGAHYVLRPTADGGWDEEDITGIRGEYVTNAGVEAAECTGQTTMVHGYRGERDCDCATFAEDFEGGCEHVDHDCACLLCDS